MAIYRFKNTHTKNKYINKNVENRFIGKSFVDHLGTPVITASTLTPKEGDDVTLTCSMAMSEKAEAVNIEYIWYNENQKVSFIPYLISKKNWDGEAGVKINKCVGENV